MRPMPLTLPSGPRCGSAPLRVGLWQPEPRDEETPGERLARLETALSRLPTDVDLVITPELFLSGWQRAVDQAERSYGPSARAAAALARRHGVGLVIGYSEKARTGVHISALCLGPGGETLGNYHKRHLFGAWENRNFHCGLEPCLIDLAGWCIGIAIGCEIAVAEQVSALVRAGASVIAVPAALPADRAVVGRAVAPTRAFENGVFVALANQTGQEGARTYSGESVVAAPSGEELARAGMDEEMLLAALHPEAFSTTAASAI